MNNNVIDWTDYTDEDIVRFIGELETELHKRQADKRQTLKERIEAMLKEEGLRVSDVFPQAGSARGRRRGTRTRAARQVKYRNPNDPTQTWTGTGRKPVWVISQLSAGKQLADLAV